MTDTTPIEDEKEASLDCRMYAKAYPEVDEVVMVQVKSIGEMGAYVSILEYNNIEGMILLSELSRRRIRSISRLIRVGHKECVVVLRVDEQRGYIDLSKRRVTPEDIAATNDRYQKSKAVHTIMRHTAEIHHLDLEEFYTQVGWPLYKKYGHAHEAFRIAVHKPDEVFSDLPISKEIRDTLLKNIKKRLKSNPFIVRAEVEVTCFAYDGIGAIRAALRAGEALGTDKNPVQIRLVAAPVFSFETITTDEEQGKNLVLKVIETVEKIVKGFNGEITVKEEPTAIKADEKKKLLTLHSQFKEELEEEEAEFKATVGAKKRPKGGKKSRAPKAKKKGGKKKSKKKSA